MTIRKHRKARQALMRGRVRSWDWLLIVRPSVLAELRAPAIPTGPLIAGYLGVL